MRQAYQLALAAGLLGACPVYLWRRAVHGRPMRVRERLGFGGTRQTAPCGWIHAVSVGEVLAAEPLIRAIRARRPGLPLVVSTVTETGAALARDRLGAMAAHRFFPVDLPGPVGRVLASLRPAFFVAVETELWPTLLAALGRRGIPAALVNGRISDRSFRRYRHVRSLLAEAFEAITVFAMRTEDDARRICELGAPVGRVRVTGDLKEAATGILPSGERDRWRAQFAARPGQGVFVAGSTHPGEEAVVLEAWSAARRLHPELLLVLAPRHPERAGEVERLVQGTGASVVRRSALGPASGDHARVILLDTVGELARIYAAADVAFVGGSLVAAGGHNVLEAARAGTPVLVGPHTSNFVQAVGRLVAAGGGEVVASGDALALALIRLLGDEYARSAMGAAGRRTAAPDRAVVDRTLEALAPVLGAA